MNFTAMRKPVFIGIAAGVASALLVSVAAAVLVVYAFRGPAMVEDPNFRQAGENAERLMENRWIDSGLGKGGTPRASTGVLGVSEPRPGVYLVVGGFFEPKTKTEGEWLARVRRRGTYWELVDASP